ncbi:hypothetical protein [Frateuria defendens]|uniref:hypothetical protein n=1 Tax=Frateuria defendens TaxID=2219559 RepID=UPI00066FD402|nr:hypothetical protein [Frateuria defendens]
MFDSRKHRAAAALVALAYVAIQSFQWFVFARLPPADVPAQALMQGPLPLNVARAVAMLLAFPGLAYLFLVVCGLVHRRRPALAVAAFLGFFVFCLLEVQLRSVELFYVYLELPARYQAAASAAGQARVLAAQAAFQSVQHALYFPLGLSWLIASTLVCLGLGGHRLDGLAQWAFGLNAVRLLLRMLDAYVLGPRFDALYEALYLPLVFLTFLPLAAWLHWGGRDGAPAPPQAVVER